jgi:hypothetical protein
LGAIEFALNRRNCLKRKTRRTLNIATDRAAHVLHVLIEGGKLTAKDVTGALKRPEEMIHELRQRLQALEHGALSAVERTGRKIARKFTGEKRKMSPARLAALRLNGKYMGHVRRLSKAQKVTVKTIRETKGVVAGIAAAKRMGNG